MGSRESGGQWVVRQWRAIGGRNGGGQWRAMGGSGKWWGKIFLTQVPNWVQPILLRVRLVISDCI
ncbi:7679_t:CDS:2, partial [Funneliformis caledonium]